MIFKDILPDHAIDFIEVRIHDEHGEDLLVGFCAWDMRDLIALDEGIYERCWLIEDYEYNDDGMLVWIKPTWV